MAKSHNSLFSIFIFKVKLRDEFEPTNFLEQVPANDKAGKPLPSWKRLLVARQLAERAQKEHDEKQKVTRLIYR